MATKKCVLLTCDRLKDYPADEALAVPALEAQGWHVDIRSWSDGCDWSRYQTAVIRTTWDYTGRLEEYLQALRRISRETTLLNPLATLEWNVRKTYLKDLAGWGVPCIPTEFSWPEDWGRLFSAWGTGRIMVKPQVGAAARGTHLIGSEDPPKGPLFAQRPLIQPFRAEVLAEGEYSFHFFGETFSHAIRKVPKTGDYRVQEEHGGKVIAVVPEARDLEHARTVIDIARERLGRRHLYARVDSIRDPDGGLELIELELIEPALYLRTDPSAPARFARALAEFA